MQAPTFTETLPTITSIAFTPSVEDVPSGATYWLNGVQQVGGFGLITDSGTYNLVVKDAAGDLLAGSSFNFVAVSVPEPMSMGILGLGGLLLLRRRA